MELEIVLLPAEAVTTFTYHREVVPETPDFEYRRNEWCPGCDARLPPWFYGVRQCRRCGYSTSALDVV
jgi:hypothetical protein